MPTPSAQDYAIDLALTNFMANYRLAGLVGRTVVTVVPSAKENLQYHKYTKGDIFRLPNTFRAEGAEANEIEIGKTKVAVACDEHSIRIPLTYRSRDNADNVLNIRTAKVQWATDIIQLRLESKIAALYADTSIPSTTLAGTAQWQVAGGGEGSTSNPEVDIDTGKESIRQKTGGRNPNIIIVPSQQAKILKRHSKIRDIVKYTHSDLATTDNDLPPSLFGMKVWIPTPSQTTSKEGATDTFGDVWGDNVYLAYVSPIPDPDTFTFASLFLNKEEVRVYDMPWRKSEMIEPSMIYKEAIVDAQAAYAIKDISAII